MTIRSYCCASVCIGKDSKSCRERRSHNTSRPVRWCHRRAQATSGSKPRGWSQVMPRRVDCASERIVLADLRLTLFVNKPSIHIRIIRRELEGGELTQAQPGDVAGLKAADRP